MSHKIKALLAGAAALAAWSAPASAGTLRVNPVRLELGGDRKTATLTVRNDDPTPVTVRAYPLGWSQADGEDRYEKTAALIVSPPIATIAPGATQIVRIGFRDPAAAGQAYRIMVEEVPLPAAGGGVQVALRLNLPLFATMEQGKVSDLRWSADRQSNGSWAFEAVNETGKYVRIEPDEGAAATGTEAKSAPFGVVLPNSRRRWTVAEAGIQDRARLTAIAGSAHAASTTARGSK